MSRLAPDRRPARWWPVALSTLGWRCLKRVQGQSCPGLHPTVDRLAGGPWPSPHWVGGALKESRASRVQACTRPSTGSQGPRHPGGGDPFKRHPSGTNMHCDKGHTVVTRATATGAEDIAISLDPLGQGRQQRSRWSRPGSCRTRTVPVIPRSTRRVPVEISRP